MNDKANGDDRTPSPGAGGAGKLRSLLGSLPPALRPSGPVLGLPLIFAVLIPVVYWRGNLGGYLSWHNVQNVMHQSAVPAVVGVGMLLIMISGGIDLSVGSVVALVTVVTMKVFRALEMEYGVGGASCAAVGAGVGDRKSVV